VWAAVFDLLVSFVVVGLSLLIAGLAAAVGGLVVPVGIAVRRGQARSR